MRWHPATLANDLPIQIPEDRATRQCRSMPELRAAKEASSAGKVRFIPGRFDENCMWDSGVHSVRGSAGASCTGTVSDTPKSHQMCGRQDHPYRRANESYCEREPA